MKVINWTETRKWKWSIGRKLESESKITSHWACVASPSDEHSLPSKLPFLSFKQILSSKSSSNVYFSKTIFLPSKLPSLYLMMCLVRWSLNWNIFLNCHLAMAAFSSLSCSSTSTFLTSSSKASLITTMRRGQGQYTWNCNGEVQNTQIASQMMKMRCDQQIWS